VIRVLLDNDYPIDLIFEKMQCRIKELIRRISVKKTRTKNGKKNDRKIVVFPYVKNISETITHL